MVYREKSAVHVPRDLVPRRAGASPIIPICAVRAVVTVRFASPGGHYPMSASIVDGAFCVR
jgi:hypothetical protein